jgi:hypothetical protein
LAGVVFLAQELPSACFQWVQVSRFQLNVWIVAISPHVGHRPFLTPNVGVRILREFATTRAF